MNVLVSHWSAHCCYVPASGFEPHTEVHIIVGSKAQQSTGIDEALTVLLLVNRQIGYRLSSVIGLMCRFCVSVHASV